MQREELERRLGRKMSSKWHNDPRILVSPEDEWLLQWKWTIWASPSHRTDYAVRNGAGMVERFYLHRVVVDAQPGEQVDHINRNGLDNRRCNLRLADNSQNHANVRHGDNNASGYKGVQLNSSGLRWTASIGHKGRHIKLGCFESREDAARAYDKAAIELFGEFALTNEALGFLDPAYTPPPDPRRGKLPARNTSGFRGVTWDKQWRKWRACCDSRTIGRFATAEEAARAFDAKHLELGRNPVSTNAGMGLYTP